MRRGDRIRVTYEGIFRGNHLAEAQDGTQWGFPTTATVEVLPPIEPTVTGTIVLDANKDPYRRRADGAWRAIGVTGNFTWADLAKPVRVLYAPEEDVDE